MIDKDRVLALLQPALEEREAFLIELSVDASNKISVVADSMKGVSLEDITALSRAIEHQLDREVEDFALTVSSPGVGSPLQVPQQYRQNIGRDLKLSTTTGEIVEGELVAFADEQITLAWRERVAKEKGKGKTTIEVKKTLNLADINEAKVQVRFK